MKKIFLNKNNVLFIFLLFILLLIFLSPSVFCATPKLISTIQSAFEEIEGWILKIATPVAAVSTASGFFMQKFSFGDEEKIRLGKKLVRNSLISYICVLAIDLILSAIKSLVN